MRELRFATIGSSAITERFVDALAQTEGAVYAAAYSRDLERARAFGEPRGASAFFDSLDELASSDSVDAVYVASPNALHAPQARQMLSAGKHVLVEKAFASNEREAQGVFELARESGVVCLEAMRNLYTQGFANIRSNLPRLGTPSQASFRFGKVTSRIARLQAGEYVSQFDPRLSEGALMDIGVYSVEPAVALFGRPRRVCASAVTLRPNWCEDERYSCIDLGGCLVLEYDGLVVDINYSKLADDLLESQVAGDAGTLHWGEPSAPRDVTLNPHEDKGMIYGDIAGAGQLIKADDPQNDMRCELELFVAAVRGDADALARVADAERTTLGALSVMDEARVQIGVRFPADEE